MATTITITINPGSAPEVATSTSAPPLHPSARSLEQVTGVKPVLARSDEHQILDFARAETSGQDKIFDETLKHAIFDENEALKEKNRELVSTINSLKRQLSDLDKSFSRYRKQVKAREEGEASETS